MRKEQEFVDLLHERLDALRSGARTTMDEALPQAGGTFQARLERDVLVAEQAELLAGFEAGEHGLCFGRLAFRDGRDHHIGRIGIRRDDVDRTPLVIDWR
ncbi:helicase, partial [Streptomyces sp. SID8354]|nr:helicase [Streptomyces sp. SID8354]